MNEKPAANDIAGKFERTIAAQRLGTTSDQIVLPSAWFAAASADEQATLLSECMATLAVLLDTKQFANAEAVARLLIALEPDSGLGWKALSVVLCEQAKYGAALEALGKAAELLPDDDEVRRYMALAIDAQSDKCVHCAPPMTHADVCERHANSRIYNHLSGALVATVPVLVPSFNNVTYVRGIIPQLRAVGLRNIIIIDNASTAPAMLSYLDEIQDEVTVVKLDHNAGPRSIFLSKTSYARLPDIFCITDPDLEFNPSLPAEFLFEMIEATELFRTGKAGFALDISNPQSLRDCKVRYGDRDYTILEWESRFWNEHIGTTAGGDPIYNAPVDTTFAVYNKRFFDPARHICGVRFGGRYTCRHLPWYEESGMSADEEAYYRAHQKWSTYLPQRT